MEKLFEVWVPEAKQKIFEADEIIAIKKTSAKKYSAKQLRAKRRKTEAKVKNKRRKLGTSCGNPYRGNPGDYYRHERMYNKFGMDRVMKHEYDKIKAENREYIGKCDGHEVEVEVELEAKVEEYISDEPIPTALDYFMSGDYEMFYFCLRNDYPKEKVISAIKSLDEVVN